MPGRSADAPPLFSVVVPVFDGGRDLHTCLESLQESAFSDWELLVVDDGSRDDSIELARSFGARVVETGGRRGPAAARNLGAEHAAGEYLFFLDADCAVHRETLSRAADLVRSNPDLDALFGSYDDEPASPGWASQYKNLQHHFVHQHGEERASTFWSGCGAMRLSVFRELGGFDSEIYRRPSIEDIELGYRLAETGGRILLAKNVQVQHLKNWHWWQVVASDFFDRGVPWTELLVRTGRRGRELNLSWTSRGSVLAALGLALALPLSWTRSAWLWAAGCAAVALVVLNLPFYRFLRRKRGLLFTIAALPQHWLHYLVCAAAYAWGRLLRWRPGIVDTGATRPSTS